MKKIILLLCLICPILSYATSQDSVMTAPITTASPSIQYQGTSASSGNVYSYTYSVQYQTSVCPSGLTVSSTGSSIYNSAQRTVTTTYLGSEIVGTSTSAWTDIDTDCTGTQTQTIACPAGYNGTITQQRKVGTASNGNGTLQYGTWATTANSCSLVQTQTLACPSGYTGSITQQRTSTISIDGTYNYTSWITTANTCVSADPSTICLQSAKSLFPSFYFASIYTQTGYTGNGIASKPGTVVDLSGATTPGGGNIGIIACYFDSNNVLDELIAPGTYIGAASNLRYVWYFNNFNGTGYN